MTSYRRYILTAALVLLGAAAFLGGCGNPTGYSEQAPPSGGPQQNSNVPPGERAKLQTNATNSSAPAASGH